MNADELDRDEYRAWWEREGRGDLSICPCRSPAEDLVISPRVVWPAGHGLCPRHRIDLGGGNREMMAQAIIAGRWFEKDLTPDEHYRAQRAGQGKPPLDA